jgi:organic hydroperoxide reductase OsmC/OhrA
VQVPRAIDERLVKWGALGRAAGVGSRRVFFGRSFVLRGAGAGDTLAGMHRYRATIRWEHTTGDFRKGTYSREHTWSFDGGVTVPASSSPQVVREPYSNAAAVDPEEALVAACSSCHALSFLYVAQLRGFEVEKYEDEAVGVMTANEQKQLWVSAVELSPRITWSGEKVPTAQELEEMHERAHRECYIANSVKSEIRVKAV